MNAIKGNKIIYLYRLLKNAQIKAAAAVACQTENETTRTRDSDVTQTKDGPIRTAGEVETEITMTSFVTKESTVLDELDDAMDSGETIEVWEINMEKPVSGSTGKYHGTYYQGVISEFTTTSNSEDYAEVSMTVGVNGTGVKGECSVTKEQEELAQYVFADTTKQAAA